MPGAALLVSLGAFLSAYAGGYLALRAVRYVGIIIAIGAGIRIGAAFFDLIPEAVAYLGSLQTAMLWTAIGFLAFYAVDKLTTLHVGHETASELDHDDASHQHVGVAGAVGMGIHSFLDGVALAAGLAVGGGTAIVIAAVVIIHRFSDGIGVVSFLLAGRVPSQIAYRWLTLVAVAPIAGVLLGLDLHGPGRSARRVARLLRRVLPLRRRRRAPARGPSSRPVALDRADDHRRRDRDLRLLGGGRRHRRRGALT